MYRYDDFFVTELFDDIGRLIVGESSDSESIWNRLCELARTNSSAVAEYWNRTEHGRGIPDSAFRGASLYFFPDCEPARTFSTSGTTSTLRGQASYSPRGMQLMDLSILENARRHILAGLDCPAIIRLVPPANAAPTMIMAYGMELIARTLGHPELSDVVISGRGIEYPRLIAAVNAAIAAAAPTVLIGASFAFVNLCEYLEQQGQRFALPPGSRVIDAGGFKGRSRAVGVTEMRKLIVRTFGVAADGFVNLFGMTELASQLYDARDVSVGPLEQRPKGGAPFVKPRIRDAHSMTLRNDGLGLLEVVDLCVLDRPPVVLTGDWGIRTPDGVAVVGRIERGQNRGCSLALDELTGPPGEHHA